MNTRQSGLVLLQREADAQAADTATPDRARSPRDLSEDKWAKSVARVGRSRAASQRASGPGAFGFAVQ
jgi:hypothetical protein